MYAVSLSGSSTTSFQTLLDTGGDVCCSPCLGLYYLLSGLRRILGEMYAVLLVWVFTTSFQTLLDNGGDGCCLLVWVSTTSFQTLLDNGGDGMLSPRLGLYYLLSGLRRIMGEMDAVSLSGSLLPAFRPCWIMGELECCLLVWASTTCFQAFAG